MSKKSSETVGEGVDQESATSTQLSATEHDPETTSGAAINNESADANPDGTTAAPDAVKTEAELAFDELKEAANHETCADQ